MIHREFRALPAALAEQFQVIEMDALGAAHAMVQTMHAEQSERAV